MGVGGSQVDREIWWTLPEDHVSWPNVQSVTTSSGCSRTTPLLGGAKDHHPFPKHALILSPLPLAQSGQAAPQRGRIGSAKVWREPHTITLGAQYAAVLAAVAAVHLDDAVVVHPADPKAGSSAIRGIPKPKKKEFPPTLPGETPTMGWVRVNAATIGAGVTGVSDYGLYVERALRVLFFQANCLESSGGLRMLRSLKDRNGDSPQPLQTGLLGRWSPPPAPPGVPAGPTACSGAPAGGRARWRTRSPPQPGAYLCLAHYPFLKHAPSSFTPADQAV